MIPLSNQASKLFDKFYHQQLEVATKVNKLPWQEANYDRTNYDLIHDLANEQAITLADLVDHGGQELIKRVLHQHPFHQEILLQSVFIKLALMKPYGYAGDKDLMLMICENEDRGDTNFAILENRVYLNLPAAEAVRQRGKAIYEILKRLPEGSNVLNLACGPALEVRRFTKEFPDRHIHFDLVDHDIHTIKYLQRTINDPRVIHILGNAFDVIKGNLKMAIPKRFLNSTHDPRQDFRGLRGIVAPLKYSFYNLQPNSYDLIYSLGLFDYIKTFSNDNDKGAPALTRRLFELVKCRGRLMIANYLTMSESNPHKKHHRVMMEVYSEWNLIYRSSEEIKALIKGVPCHHYSISLTDEYFSKDERGLKGSIGVLVVDKN